MDILDQTQQTEALFIDLALRQRTASAHSLPYIGQCYNCEAALPDGVRFCDCDCRNDYERRQRAEGRA